MATTTGSINIPILARFDGKDIEVGVLTLEVKIVNGRVRPPTGRDLKTALRRGLR